MSSSPSSAVSVVSRIRSVPLPTMSTRSFGTTDAVIASWARSTSTRLCGTSRVTTVIVGSGSRGERTSGDAELPLGTMWIGPRKPSRRRSSWRVDGDTATVGRSL